MPLLRSPSAPGVTGRRVGATGVVALCLLAVALAGCGSDDGDDGTTAATSIEATAPKTGLPFVLCKGEAPSEVTLDDDVQLLVDNLVRQASLAEELPYERYERRCDNTGVTAIDTPAEYADVGPALNDPPQTAIRASTDLGAPVEAVPIISFFAAPYGGSQFPTLPGFTTLIQQSADGSLSSGTRDPREGETISEECRSLPVRDLATGTFTGKAQFFVNCGDDRRAWVLAAATPNSGDPYFVQVVAQVRDTADAEALGRALATLSVDAEALTAFTQAQEAAAAAAPPPVDAPTTTAPAAP
ncbi:MAG: hypothetical protein KDB10_15310 [Acidimicrobiales bacterium]|nr:hypothetical protein [Acidimicrobiales bacterium]